MENLDKIFRLVEAGYTKEEINAMLQPEPKPEEQPEEKPAEAPKEEVKSEADAQAEYLNAMRDITNEFKKIRDDLQKSALISDGFEIKDPLEESRKVLASIIDPPHLKERKD